MVAFFLCLMGRPSDSWAKGGISFELEPLYGYERVQKSAPTSHAVDRPFYGLRVRGGSPALSFEVGALRASDTEAYPLQDLTLKDSDDRYQLGVVTLLGLSRATGLALRGGVQGTRRVHESTTGGINTVTTNPLTYAAYAGFGFVLRLSRFFGLSISGTVVSDLKTLSKSEYQTSAGFLLRFP
jgi:hypothetical protein